jgi:AcrR family transcriptional regulator
MGKQAPDAQGSPVKEAIFSALMALLRKKSLSEVTITELSRKAGVSRMAFYRNYSSKDDIIVNYLDEQFSAFLAKIQKAKEPNAYQDAYWYFTFFKKNQHLVQKLIDVRMHELLFDRHDAYLRLVAARALEVADYDEDVGRHFVEYVSGGLRSVVLEWARAGMKEGPEKMAGIILKLARK